MSWLLSFKGLSLGKGRKNKRNSKEQQDSQGRQKRLKRPSSSCYSGSYDLATPSLSSIEERPNRFSWASPFEEEYMNNNGGKTEMASEASPIRKCVSNIPKFWSL